MCNRVTLLHKRNSHSVVNQLYFRKKKKAKQQMPPCPRQYLLSPSLISSAFGIEVNSPRLAQYGSSSQPCLNLTSPWLPFFPFPCASPCHGAFALAGPSACCPLPPLPPLSWCFCGFHISLKWPFLAKALSDLGFIKYPPTRWYVSQGQSWHLLLGKTCLSH